VIKEMAPALKRRSAGTIKEIAPATKRKGNSRPGVIVEVAPPVDKKQ
jgi:hypothetical protein